MDHGVSGQFRLVLSLLCWCFLAMPCMAQAGQETSAECLFNWAENNYAPLFSPAGSPRAIA